MSPFCRPSNPWRRRYAILLLAQALVGVCAAGPVGPDGPASVASAPASAPEARPDLFFDGEALANRVTQDLLANTYPGAPLRLDRVPRVREKLYRGEAFGPEERPNAVRLREWMMSRPDDSILPHELIAEAVSLENQSVQRALMLCWDVLRKDYRNAEQRNTFPHILKLKDITGELELFDGQEHALPPGTPPDKRLRWQGMLKTVRGDKFGSWYHFIGTAVNSFYRTASRAYPFSGRWETEAMIIVEEKIRHNEHMDPRKRVDIDRAGALFGEKLARNLRAYRSAGEFARSRDGARTDYLYDDPARYGGKWRLKEGQHPRDFGTDLRTRDRDPVMTRLRRARALLTVPGIFSAEAARDARNAMMDGVDAIREAAGDALAARTDSASLALLESIARGPGTIMAREEAVRALARRVDPEAFPVFTRVGLKAERWGPDYLLRATAIQALPSMPKRSRAQALMARIYAEGDPFEQAWLIRGMETFDPAWRAPFLRQALRSAEKKLYSAAVDVLARARDPESLEVAREFLLEAAPPRLSTRQALKAYFKGKASPEWARMRRYAETRVKLFEALAARDDAPAWTTPDRAPSSCFGFVQRMILRDAGKAGAPGRAKRRN